MSWWLNENFSEQYIREKFAKGEEVLLMVLHYCAVCDVILPDVEPIAEYHRETIEQLDTNIEYGVYRVNERGNLVIHRSYGKKCKLHSNNR